MDGRQNGLGVRPRTITLVLLMLAGIVNFLDRSSLSMANGSIRAEMHVSATQMGVLFSIFSLTYGCVQLPVGPLLDRLGSRLVLGIGLGVWSLAQALSGLAGSMRSLAGLRALLGLGESPFFPASVKIVGEQFPPEQRGQAIAAVNISTTIGQGLAPPLLTLLLLSFGWRTMFTSIGILGLLLTVTWFALEQEPATVQAGSSISRKDWLALFRTKSIWGLMIGFGGVNYTSWFYISWLPDYLQRARGVSIAHTGWLAALPFLAGSLGMFASGKLADRRVGEGERPAEVHRKQIVFGLVASALCTLIVSHMATLAAAVGSICAALFFIHFAGTSAWGLVQAASPRGLVATIGSVQNFGSFVIASTAPLLTGWTLDRTHTFAASFLLCAAVTLIGAASYFFVVSTYDFGLSGGRISELQVHDRM
jgi:MFS family permease